MTVFIIIVICVIIEVFKAFKESKRQAKIYQSYLEIDGVKYYNSIEGKYMKL